ncbi:peptidase family M49-domain-containing protein [Aspergillus aurantiobrunneus]
MALFRGCKGDWDQLAATAKVEEDSLQKFLNYAALFLSNIGNYFGSGYQIFVPGISRDDLLELASPNLSARRILDHNVQSMFSQPPNSLGGPGSFTQTTYYLGEECLASPEDLSAISILMKDISVHPENTRLRKYTHSGSECYDILQASILENTLDHSDHKQELQRICQLLREAIKYASNPAQKQLLQMIIDGSMAGDLEVYKRSQEIWVTDKAAPVETVLGFIEPYRDPLVVRAEFEGIVGIPDPAETKILNELARVADKFVNRLPWVVDGGNKGPFEKDLFEPPDFSRVQSLAYCSSIVFPGINLPNFGYKNIIFSNRMAAERIRTRGLPLVDEAERETFRSHRSHSYYIWVVLHEILGHGTGKFLAQVSARDYNFDVSKPPLNPLTGKPVDCWYGIGQTWTGVFGELVTTVDECRAELVGAYLIDEPDILSLFGYTEKSGIDPQDCRVASDPDIQNAG